MNTMISQTVAQLVTNYNLQHYFPAPERFYSPASSMFVAAGLGYGYALIGRVVYPNTGIIPAHYAIWFTVAFQIKYCITHLENRFEKFMGVEHYIEKLQEVPEEELKVSDQLRYHIWKVIKLKDLAVKKIDAVFSGIFHIRPYMEIKEENVDKASFIEMCRYRVWSVFKLTILNSVSSVLAYHLTKEMGFSLPSRTSVQLFIVIQSIVVNILFVPAVYTYFNFCNALIDWLGEGDEKADYLRKSWIGYFLPKL